MLRHKTMVDIRDWRGVIDRDFPSMLPKTREQDYALRDMHVLTPSLFEELKAYELSRPLP